MNKNLFALIFCVLFYGELLSNSLPFNLLAQNLVSGQHSDSIPSKQKQIPTQDQELFTHKDTLVYLQEATSPSIKHTYDLELKTDKNTAIQQRKFTPYFKDKYKTDPDFSYTEQQLSTWAKIKKSIERFLMELFDFNIDAQSKSNLNIFLRVLSFVGLFLIIYYLIKAYLSKDIYWLFKKTAKNFQIDFQQVESNLQQTDLQTLINQSVDSGNYRTAIRLYYLWVVKHLDQQGVLSFNTQKTNSAYLTQIKDPLLKEDFNKICYLYNHIWYGQRTISLQEFTLAKQSFIKILNHDKS
ncbi:hypothetical protein [Myroides sp. LJL119]